MDKIRKDFEAWIMLPPYEHMCDRNSEKSAWRGAYKRYETELAWDAWQAAIPDPCEWLQDEWDNSYDTSCGNKYQIIEGTPEHNGMNYCTYCGGKLEAITGDATRAETQGQT